MFVNSIFTYHCAIGGDVEKCRHIQLEASVLKNSINKVHRKDEFEGSVIFVHFTGETLLVNSILLNYLLEIIFL